MNNKVVLYVPKASVAYKLTSAITISSPLTIRGDDCVPYTGSVVSGQNVRGSGSWFYLAHTGKGFVMNIGSGELTGVVFDSIGTYRDQPAPAASWAPTNHDFDFYCT